MDAMNRVKSEFKDILPEEQLEELYAAFHNTLIDKKLLLNKYNIDPKVEIGLYRNPNQVVGHIELEDMEVIIEFEITEEKQVTWEVSIINPNTNKCRSLKFKDEEFNDRLQYYLAGIFTLYVVEHYENTFKIQCPD